MALICLALTGGPIDLSYDAPTLDRWLYPFNGTPGSRISASVFGATNEPDFDDRDGQIIVAFDTAGDVTPGQGPDAYDITSATLTIQTDGQVDFVYDPTSDSYVSFLPEDDPDYVPDGDAGQPLELFGVDYRNGFDLATFEEDSSYGPSVFGEGIRSAFAIDEGSDIGNHVRDRYDPDPWAVGAITGLAPGDDVPAGTDIVFTIDVATPDVQAYLRESIDQGRVTLAVTSLHMVMQQTGSFPTIYMKENPLVVAGIASPIRLEMTIVVGDGSIPGDIDGDGDVDVEDLLAVLGAWGPCDPCPCDADTDDDCVVGINDLLTVLGNWTV